LGFVVLGIFSFNVQGMEGAIIQMVNHGISTGALFLLVGMIYDRRHTRQISDFGGLATSLPVFSTFFMLVTLSSIGLPMMNGFVGEFLVLLGSFKTNSTYAVIAATGVILSAVYMLWMYQRVVFGEIKNPKNREITDLGFREKLILVPIIVMIFWIGIGSGYFLRTMDSSVNQILQPFQTQSLFVHK